MITFFLVFEQVAQSLKLNTRLSERSWVSYMFFFFFSYDDLNNTLYKLGDDDLDEEDPFAEVSTNISLFNLVLICF